MSELLAGDWENIGPLRTNERLTVDELSLSILLVNARRLLAAVQEMGGAPATPEGGFTPEVVASMVRHLWWGRNGELEVPPGDLAQSMEERNLRPIQLARAALESFGALARIGDRLVVTPDGAGLLSRERGGALYAGLLRAYFRDLDHSTLDAEPAIPVAWRYVPYSLWMIGQLKSGWWNLTALLRALLPPEVAAAENERLRALPVAPGRLYTPTVQELFLMRFIEPLQDFALLESRPSKTKSPVAYPDWRRGPLYDRALRFEW